MIWHIFYTKCRILNIKSHEIANCVYCCNAKISAYKCIGANSLDDFEENVSFTENVGTDKKGFSYEGRDVITFSCASY